MSYYMLTLESGVYTFNGYNGSSLKNYVFTAKE